VIQIDNHIPEQPASIINFTAPPVTVSAPAVTFSPVIEPVFNVPVPSVVVPPRDTVTTIERDRDGNIVRATQRDTLQ